MYVPNRNGGSDEFENIAVTPENLFLRKPLPEYRVVLVSVNGNVNVVEIIEQVLGTAKVSKGDVSLLLGPTSPFDSPVFQTVPVAWVASIDPLGGINENVEIIDPHKLLDISIFIDRQPRDAKRPKIVIGDFLDSLFLANGSIGRPAVFLFFNHLVSRAKKEGLTLVLILSEKLHDERDVQMVRRFADVIIECRERLEDDRTILETRGINFADRIQTCWIPGRRESEASAGITQLEENSFHRPQKV
jgi:hypothetical protein